MNELLNKFKEILANPKVESMSGGVSDRTYDLSQEEMKLIIDYVEKEDK